jgi:hypothetical protein
LPKGAEARRQGAYKMRDHEQAAKDLELLKDAMAACENCK